MKTEIERMGERKIYKGVFSLYKTNDVFKYAPYGYATSFEFMKTFFPKIKLNQWGIYIGKGLFMIDNGDIFKENEKS